ncbi:MAG: aldose 1-epimerase family protein [Anaerolineae bacterium]|nr:aldose 1-epimerase family protein [Anaerolineae bacterium]
MAKDWLNHDLINKHSLDMRQFIDFRESTLPNGMRIIDAYNSSGLTFTILPDRGMDIWTAHYNGMPLTWISSGSPHPPDYGQSWLSLFNGGLLTTCGLTHVGAPEDGRDIHGNYTRQRATAVSSDMKNQVMRLKSTLHQSRLFGEQFEVTRTYTLNLGKTAIHVSDEITNIGDEPTPFMLLYHCNVGYPLVREGTELLVASDIYPRDDDALSGVETWQTYEGASVGYPEQVFFHHAKQDNTHTAQAALFNEDIGLKFAWKTDTLPYLTQWKNTRQGIYVCGIEPGNCIPEGQNAARESGRLVMLQPNETQSFDLTIEVLDGAEAIQQCRAAIERLQTDGTPVADCNLAGYEH